ncbi:hypothetical protein DC31_16945 [Microbacterium sp. CH12i]|uniref:FHA domain-containing protein n=1 Tax=Microbacterium sp. CH12i TaxID=1479651 RepID=UPI0004610A29|nr:FHA domain-containing protein [Microbacterium sp. CH12i]KDA05436.1 hypothetical protein DC31_16945 [Microbacterium sp. CH12i]
MQTTYRTGKWYVLVTPGALIALPPDAPIDLVTQVWDHQQSERNLAAVIDALTAHAAGSFADMLPFAAVVMERGDARIAVRGDVTVRVTGPHGVESFGGSNVTTWSERFVANASGIALLIADASDEAELPVRGGVVRAAEVNADLEDSDLEESDIADEQSLTDAVAPEPARAEEAEAEPEVEAEPDLEAEPEVEAVPEPELETELDDSINGATLIPTEVTYASDADEFDQLFGATVAAPSAVAPPAAAPPVPAPPVPVPLDGDHDGATISVAEARALRQNAPVAGPDAATAVLPVVQGSTGRIRVSTGQVVSLDRTVIIGRRPRSTRASGADLPHLVAVESPQQDISRSHLEIRPEGDTILVIDLHTTNGSTLLRHGADPLRLHPGEQTVVLSGDTVDLGDGVTVTFEDLP